jgi:glycosidase
MVLAHSAPGAEVQSPDRVYEALTSRAVIPANTAERLAEPWLNEEALFYHLLPDRHLNGDGIMDLERADQPVRVGGNIQGITGDLNRIAYLGYTVVWDGPIAKNPPDGEHDQHYHFYHPDAIDMIDPQLGTDNDLLEHTSEAHERGQRVIIDIVPNHCSDQHPHYQKAIGKIPLEPGDPVDGFRSWFKFDPKTGKPMTFLGYGDLIKLNIDNPDVVSHLQAAMRKWIDLGVDGFRVDHIIGLSNRNVDELFGPLKKEFPGMALIGEAWMGEDGCMVKWSDLNTLRVPRKRLIWALGRLGLDTASSTLLYSNYVGRLDGVLDFTASKMIESYATASGPKQKERIKNRLIKWTGKFRGKLLQVVFADNHDMPRAMYRFGDNEQTFKDAIELMYSLQTPVANYAGTEYGATQDGPFPDWHGDVKARQPLESIQAQQVPGMFEFFRGVIRKRHKKSNTASAQTAMAA